MVYKLAYSVACVAASRHSDPDEVWPRPHKVELELIIPIHHIYLCILPSFVCPELAKIPLFGLAII